MNSEAAPLHTPGEPEGRKVPCVLQLFQAWKGRRQLLKDHVGNQPTLTPAPVSVVFPLLFNFL